MRVYLPSNGMMGLYHVEVRPPKLRDLREVPNLGQSSIIKKTQFLHQLVGDDIYKVTPSDRDYLFVIAVGAITLNTISMSVDCSCGASLTSSLSIGDLNPIRLKRDISPLYRVLLDKQEYLFHRLSVKDEVDIEERAIDLPDEDYDKEFQDGVVAKTLGYSLSKEDIDKVREMDLSLYMAALLYQSLEPHGISLLHTLKCPKCGKLIRAHLPISGDLLNVDVAEILKRYISLRDSVSLEGYLDLTMVEVNTMIKALNEEMRKK